MKTDYTIGLISGYKILVNSLRIILGTLIIYFRGNIRQLVLFVFKNEIKHEPGDFLFNFVYVHLKNQTPQLAILLALMLIIFSILEIIFSISLLYRKKSGAIGLFVTSFLWIPVEILFVSRFLFIHKIVAIIIDAIILLALFKIIHKFKRISGKS